MRVVAGLLALGAAIGVSPALAQQPLHEICAACHTGVAEDFRGHPHLAAGLDCDICHGKSERHREAAGAAPPDRVAAPHQVAALCGSCHIRIKGADESEPSLPEQYASSKHGLLVAAMSRTRAPNCGTCHGVHRVRAARAMETRCSRCHSSRPEDCAAEPRTQAKVRCAGCHAPHLFTLASGAGE